MYCVGIAKYIWNTCPLNAKSCLFGLQVLVSLTLVTPNQEVVAAVCKCVCVYNKELNRV